MKQFSTVREALSLHTHCPCCRDYLTVKDSPSSIFSYATRKITFPMSGGDQVSVNCDNNDVSLTLCSKPSFDPFYATQRLSALRSYDGIMYEGINPVCHTCRKFSYGITVKIDLNDMKISGIFLNSETIVVYDTKGSHEVRNVYWNDQSTTTYSCGDKKETIPLVPLNLSNPQETVDRIRKLLIFS